MNLPRLMPINSGIARRGRSVPSDIASFEYTREVLLSTNSTNSDLEITSRKRRDQRDCAARGVSL